MCGKLSLRCCTRVPLCVSCLREGSPCDQDLASGLEHPSSRRPNGQLISDSVHLVRGNQDSERSSMLPKDTLLQEDRSEDLNPGPSDSRPRVSALLHTVRISRFPVQSCYSPGGHSDTAPPPFSRPPLLYPLVETLV